MDNFNKELLVSLETGFVEQAVNSKTLLQPMFITNDNSCILFYNMIDYKYQDLQVASLQIYESLIWAKTLL